MLLESSGFAASQIPSQGTLDDQINAYFNSVTTLESSASSLQEGQVCPLATPEISNLESLQPQARQATPAPPARAVTPHAKLMERRTAIASTTSRPTEVRNPGRGLVRPALVTEEPHTDTEMPAAEASSATEEVKTGTTSNEPVAPPASTSLLRKRGPSSDPREEPGIQAAVDISEAAAPPLKKYKEAAVSQETTQDTEPTPVPAVPAVPTWPEIPEVIPEPVVPSNNVDAQVNAEEMDADQTGGEEVIEATREEDSTNKDEMELDHMVWWWTWVDNTSGCPLLSIRGISCNCQNVLLELGVPLLVN